jgi:hypothetical protein
MVKTLDGGLSRLKKNIKHVVHGTQPAQELNGEHESNNIAAHANLCGRCARIPMSPERLERLDTMLLPAGRRRDASGLWRLYEIKDLSPEDCQFCRLLWET